MNISLSYNDLYISYNHSNNFLENIGDELFKLSIALSIALKYNKTIIFNDENFIKIFETQLKIPFKLIINKLDFYNHNPIHLDINTNINYNYNYSISNECIIYLTYLLSNNRDFINQVYDKINEIMNHYNDFEINNYICIIINKISYIPFNYQNILNNYNDKKIIIISDDCNWCKNYIPFINNPFFIDKKEKPLIYLFMISLFNFIILDKLDNYSLFIAYLNKTPTKNINFL
jgi:hypothetical protein